MRPGVTAIGLTGACCAHARPFSRRLCACCRGMPRRIRIRRRRVIFGKATGRRSSSEVFEQARGNPQPAPSTIHAPTHTASRADEGMAIQPRPGSCSLRCFRGWIGINGIACGLSRPVRSPVRNCERPGAPSFGLDSGRQDRAHPPKYDWFRHTTHLHRRV